jgi:uncharacterized protein (DUF2384 family)
MPGTVVLSERIEKLMNALSLSPTELAAALGTQKNVVLGWLANNEYPSPETDARLEALRRLVRRLNSTFDSPETVRAWLRSRSAYLEGRQPKDVLITGDIEAVNGALNALDAGIFV